jgi:hypothetical protein
MSGVEIPSAAAQSKFDPNPWLIAVVVALAAFMEILDTSRSAAA